MSSKIAVVTGANKGLGFAVVKELCEVNYGVVYLTSRDETRGKESCEELKTIGLNPSYHQIDITDDESISRFITYIRDTHDKVDLIINNAGILFLKDSTESKLHQVEMTMNVNFFSLVNFCEAMLPLVKDGGYILNVSSSSGHLSRIPSEELRSYLNAPDLTLEQLKNLMSGYVEDVKQNKDADKWGDSPYVVSKVGVNAYTLILHRRLSERGIKVNCVHPGYVMSEMTRGGGNVTPEQAAGVLLRLALAPEGSGLYVWSNGNAVPWDGPDPRGYIDGKTL